MPGRQQYKEGVEESVLASLSTTTPKTTLEVFRASGHYNKRTVQAWLHRLTYKGLVIRIPEGGGSTRTSKFLWRRKE